MYVGASAHEVALEQAHSNLGGCRSGMAMQLRRLTLRRGRNSSANEGNQCNEEAVQFTIGRLERRSNLCPIYMLLVFLVHQWLSKTDVAKASNLLL